MTKTPATRLAALALLAASACSGPGGGGASPAPARTTIAVIPKGTTHAFWQSIHAGAVKASRELDVDIIWRGPLREDDRDAQVTEVEGFVSRGVSGIVLAPLDESALVGPVASAKARKIPVVIFDSGLKGEDFVSFVATDNVAGGRLGGEHLAKVLGGKGKVVLLRYAEGHDSTGKREEGFLEAMKANPGLEVVSSNQYGGADVEEAYKRSETLLSRYKQPDGSLGVQGIFCANESTTFAMLRVLQANGWAGKVTFVGFDASDNLVAALRKGEIEALVIQDPVKMGYLGVKTMVQHLRGEKVERRIDTGVGVATRANMDEPAMKERLSPDLSQWLPK
jgi:ribose transport system substrate-binding protein